MQQAQQKPQPQQAQQTQQVPQKVPSPQQQQGCEIDRLMAMFNTL